MMILPQVKPWEQEQKHKLCQRLGFSNFDWTFLEVTEKKIVRAIQRKAGEPSFSLASEIPDENLLVLERPNFETAVPEMPLEVAWLAALLPYPYDLILCAGQSPYVRAEGKMEIHARELQQKIQMQSEAVTQHELAVIQLPTIPTDSEVLTVVFQFVQKRHVNVGWWDLTQYPIEELFGSLEEKKLGVKTTYLSLAI